MTKTHHTTEQIIRILRAAETGGQSHEEICRQHNVSSQTFYRWKSKYGGMDWRYFDNICQRLGTRSLTNLNKP